MMKAGKRPHPDKMRDEESTSLSMTRDDSSISPSATAASQESQLSPEDAMQEIMQDNLALMLDIIMKIREDPQFAKSIYADCPRLQHLIDQNPQLRPIFEDPRLVKISFEKAYREAGGLLPEDPKPWLARVANHPLFKFLKFIVFLKKLMALMQGGGMNMIKDWISNFRPSAESLEHAAGGDAEMGGDGGGDGVDADADPENQENRDSLNDAADKFEEPEMKEKLDRIKTIEDPEQLAEEIENDPELRALRDSNELCAELMSDPDTVKIITEPDNLRALGDCPDLFQADMADPDWSPEFEGDIDTHENYDSGVAAADGLDVDVDQDFEEAEEVDEEEEEEHEDFEGDGDLDDPSDMEEEGELDEEEDGMEFELGEEEVDQSDTARSQPGKGKGGAKKSNPKSRAEQRKAQGSNFFANVGVGLTDMIAGEIVGVSAAELTGKSDLEILNEMDEYGGGMDTGDIDGDFEDLENAVDDIAEADNLVDQVAATAEVLTEDDVCDNIDTMNDQLEGVEEVVDEHEEKKAAQSAATGGAVAGGAVAKDAENKDKSKSRSIEAGDAEEEQPSKAKSRFQFLGNFVGSVATQAKEMVATNILGDDFGEALVEKMEGGDEESQSSKGSDADSKSDVETGDKKTKDDSKNSREGKSFKKSKSFKEEP
eukprot:CAMPEP_0172454364 /NCGR_PEP_ID=MMETSP1065-20121228/11371_1 /TAXON_ID=265537 /ORGANISM="Amphiprora paludosa, Strain CCMP125" /LENGTH=656 /DNA_ID=CAMNT_0013206681 /DNA_START=26 /DNA_END=1996 /DNA_ORIENTATION=-